MVRVLSGRVVLAASVFAVAWADRVWAQGAPVVDQVTARQTQDDSKRVEVSYRLQDQSLCTVWMLVSADGGASWNVPVRTVTGNGQGPNVAPGSGKQIIWEAGTDIPGVSGDNFKVRVVADDGNGQADMVFVPAGPFMYQGVTYVDVPAFWIDKYEVTNRRYCEFLNEDEAHADYDPRMEITRTERANQPDLYAVYLGRENYPIRFVSANAASAFADWLSRKENRCYRLPTEEEWEKAAAWDPTIKRHWAYAVQSDSISCNEANIDFCFGGPIEVGHFNGSNGTSDAHSFYGCYDMSGNLWEWTGTRGGGPTGIIRGGAWVNLVPDVDDWATTGRTGAGTAERHGHLGFRLVLDPNAP